MVGNHRDAWVYGAVDPGSGTAATLEMCRAMGDAVKNGWKPRRTIVYANWDAEEYGLVGSTEWAEEHAKTVDQKVALLLNVDSAVSGKDLDMGGVPSLARPGPRRRRRRHRRPDGPVAPRRSGWTPSARPGQEQARWASLIRSGMSSRREHLLPHQ